MYLHTVKSLIIPYPRRNHPDELKVGQEDEATPDPDGVPWETEKDEKEEAEAANASDEDDEEKVLDFEPDDWADPEAAALQLGASDADGSRHGDGDDQTVKAGLSAAQADSVLEDSARLRSLKQANDILKDLGGAVGLL